MGARGRKSGASLEVVKTASVMAVDRPAAPDDLTDEQAQEWDAVVCRMPADWFPRETHGLLAQYCRHVVSARRVGQMIEDLMKGGNSDDWVADYDRLLKMQEREGRAISSLATRMRISQQSQYHKDKKRGSSVKKPF